eukprot:maker-scaffold245_size240363-snap-gene-1.22 protein:Tk06007 transcript:maker-scaffold245_size240363-snap-gene-1.22-mRNA-1 annotation:"hypothetical protein DAPPUDRAFT_54086"
MEGRVALVILLIDVGPGFEQLKGNSGIPTGAGVTERSSAVLVRHIDLGVEADEQLDHIHEAFGTGYVQGGHSFLVGGVEVRVALDQHFGSAKDSHFGRFPKQGSALTTRTYKVSVELGNYGNFEPGSIRLICGPSIFDCGQKKVAKWPLPGGLILAHQTDLCGVPRYEPRKDLGTHCNLFTGTHDSDHNLVPGNGPQIAIGQPVNGQIFATLAICKGILTRSNGTTTQWSYVSGSSQEPLISTHIGQLWAEKAQEFAHRECLVSIHQNIRKTFAQVKTDVDHLAAGFLALGLKSGDRIGIWGPNSYEWYLTQFAAGRSGLILVRKTCVEVNINPAYQPDELKYCLNLVGVKALVSAEAFKTQDYYALMNTIAPEVSGSVPGQIHMSKAPINPLGPLRNPHYFSGAFNLTKVMDQGAHPRHLAHLETIQEQIQMDDPCNIQFTSGTTGNPKGACLSHHNIVNNARFIGLRLKYGQKPHVIACSVPFYHTFGCVICNLCALIYGAKVVLPAPHFDARASLSAIQAERCTSLYGSPTMFVDMISVQKKECFDVSSVETGVMGGSTCPEELCKNVRKDLHMKNFTVCYGMTETSPVTFQGFPEDSVSLKTSTIGYPSAHTEVKVIDETGHLVPCGTPGELCTRGYSTMLGYWNDEAKTQETITPDRWLHTGDIAVIYDNGYGQIVGRIKDMINRGGENLYPREIEELLFKHPQVKEVSVIGVPDARMGEELCAWIRLKDAQPCSVDDIKFFCRGKVAHFKIPRYVLFVDLYPATVTGKIQKFKMREESIKLLNLNVQ